MVYFANLLLLRPARVSGSVAIHFAGLGRETGDAMVILHGLWAMILILTLGLAFAAAHAMRLNRRLKRSHLVLAQELQRRHRTEDALHQSEDRYRGLFEHLSYGLFQTRLDGQLIQVNPALAASAGYASPREMMASVDGDHWPFCIPPAQRAEVLSRVVEAEEPVSYEAQFRREDGEEICGRVTLRVVRDRREGGDGGSYLEGCVEDITEARCAREFAAAQREMGSQLAVVSNMEQALRVFLQTAIRVTGMDSGEIYLVDRDSGAVVLATGNWFRPECPHRIRSHPDLLSKILNAVGQPVYSRHQKSCEVGQLDGCDATMRARAIVPIQRDDTVIGWLVVKSHALSQVPIRSRGALTTLAAQIGRAVSRMQAQEDLAASQSQLKALFDSLDDLLVIVDSQGYVLEANRAAIERLGYERQDLQGKRITEVLSPDPTTQPGALLPAILRGAPDLVCITLLTRNGTRLPVEVKFAMGTWGGQRVIIALGRDRTERLKAEEQAVSLQEKTALLKEIHHRIKNNLQVISSLLSLQASQLEPGQDTEPFLESQARVQTIALLHEKLYQAPDLCRIDFGAYLGALAEHILRADRRPSADIRLRLETEPVWLCQDTAMPCGLIVNELVTNSCKYAFPGGGQGEICVSVKRAPGRKLVLRVEDNGVGLPANLDLRQVTTLGLQLVDDMVAQVQGSWTVESSGGTRFQIVFPAEGD